MTFNQAALMLTSVNLCKLVWQTVAINTILKVIQIGCLMCSHTVPVVYDSTFRAYDGLEI